MALTKLLNRFMFMENLLGIYKNFCTQTKTKKCLIIFQIIVQTILHSIIVISEVHFLFEAKESSQVKLIHGGFSTLSYVNAMSSVATGIGYSSTFMSYYRSISSIFECFKDDKFNFPLKKIYWLSITIIISTLALSLYRSSEIFMYYTQMDGDTDNTLIFVSVFVSQALNRFTIVFQKVVLFVVIMIVVQLTKCLNSLITAVQESVRSCDLSKDAQCVITREQIQRWIDLYQDLAKCCEKATLCFGRQFIFSLLLSMSYYMLLTNHMCSKNVSYKVNKKSAVIAVSYIAITMMPLVAGQLTRNQGTKFHRALVRLYNTIITIDSSEVEAKLIKDLIRLIKKHPLEIKLLSKVPAEMLMLPVILSLTVNYIIVIMQFNNII